MRAGQLRSQEKADELYPFPEGWYFVARRGELSAEKPIERQWLGEEIVAWADEEGRVCVADAYCPHLGSHLGPAVGGLVRDGCLVCPFHGFVFDVSGDCVATPNAPAPKAAKLKIYRTTEIGDMIFAWWGTGGREPQWRLPDEPTVDGWSETRSVTLRFRGHPQETTENSVDVEHLAYTHGYTDVKSAAPVAVDGAYLRSAFDFKSARKIFAVGEIVADVTAVAHVHGLGFSFVEYYERGTGLHSRLWVLSTPVDGRLIDLTLATQANLRGPGSFFTGLRFLPVGWRHRLMSRILLSEEKRFVMQDVVIWERKLYTAPPRLSRADGPIGKFRLYCRQFYPEGVAGGPVRTARPGNVRETVSRSSKS